MGNQYDKHKYAVIAEYSDLGEDGTRSGEICPACQGGSTKEGSLSISRRGGILLWHCHRASCKFSGSDRSPAPDGSESRESRNRTPDVEVHDIDKATTRLLAAKLGVPIESIGYAGIGWTGDGDGRYGRRFAFPIFDPLARIRGTSYRSYEGAKPKAIVHLDRPSDIAACWYRWRRASDNLVLVEDQVSAIRLAPFVDTLALLGTNLSDSKVDEILGINPKYQQVHLSLDADAVGDAIKTQLRLTRRGIMPNLRITAIECDVKDMDKEQFDNYLKRVIQ